MQTAAIEPREADPEQIYGGPGPQPHGATPPPATPSSPGILAPESLTGFFDRTVKAYQEVYAPWFKEIGEREATAEATRERAVRPAIGRAQRMTTVPPPPLPGTEPEPPVPSLRPRPFLATEGRGALEAVISGLGLLAQTFAGVKAGAPVAALSAVTGAMQGWAAGDAVRANRAWREYLGQVDKIRSENSQALRLWEAAMQQYGAHTQAAQAHLTAALAEAGLDDHAVLVAERGLHRSLEPLNQAVAVSKDLWDRSFKLEQLRVTEELKRAILESLELNRAELLKLKRREVDIKEKEAEALKEAYTPEILTTLGQQWFISGKEPRVGMGRSGQVMLAKVKAAGIRWAKDNGIDPMSAPVVQAEVGATKTALVKLRVQNALQAASIRRFDGHLAKLLELSQQVPRTEMPAVNRAIVAGQRDYAGSPAAAAYVVQAFEVSMELARVVLPGSAQGDEKTREEARKALATALTHEQLVLVTDTLHQNAHRNIEMNRESEQSLLEVIEAAAAGKVQPRGKGKILIGPGGQSYDGTGVDPAKLQPGWRLE